MTILAELGPQSTLFSIDAVERIETPQGRHAGGRIQRVHLRGITGVLEAAEYDVSRLLLTPKQIIPALPDTFFLWCWLDGDKPQVGRNPVVAWGLCADGRMRPMTAQGVNDGDSDPNRDFYILMPGGSVQATSEYADPSFYETLEDYCSSEGEKLRAQVQP